MKGLMGLASEKIQCFYRKKKAIKIKSYHTEEIIFQPVLWRAIFLNLQRALPYQEKLLNISITKIQSVWSGSKYTWLVTTKLFDFDNKEI